jgi:hypothetical protein
MLFKNHIIKRMAMDGVIFALVIFPFRMLILITRIMVGMLNGAVTGKRVCQYFGMVMMRHQVVSQED